MIALRAVVPALLTSAERASLRELGFDYDPFLHLWTCKVPAAWLTQIERHARLRGFAVRVLENWRSA